MSIRPTTRLTVTSGEQITPSIRRLWFHSDDLSAFATSEDTDRYVKLLFPSPDDDGQVMRTYTALQPDPVAGTLAIDFVTHGDHGTAGPWAERAEPGDVIEARGPGGGYRPDPDADWHLLVGDESAVPAIGAALAALRPDAVTRVIIEVDSPAHEPALRLPPAGQVSYVHRDAGKDLLTAVQELEWPAGQVHAFVHGEASTVMHDLRPYLLGERGLSRAQLSISGYWRRGRSEEGFRQWKSELAAAEQSGT